MQVNVQTANINKKSFQTHRTASELANAEHVHLTFVKVFTVHKVPSHPFLSLALRTAL